MEEHDCQHPEAHVDDENNCRIGGNVDDENNCQIGGSVDDRSNFFFFSFIEVFFFLIQVYVHQRAHY